MMNKLSVQSPAKLNLFLHITSKREDGYHNLQTIFQLIDLCDILHFDISHQDIRLNQMGDVAEQDNLIYRAAQLLKRETSYSGGCHIRLEKYIPMGAGLGGGSSNAATTLLVLNHLWKTGLNIEQLAILGCQLGADVPVFILGKNAWAEGIGDQLIPVKLPPSDYIVLKPDCFISTQKLFSQETLTRNTTITTFAAYQRDHSCFGNNFEDVALKLYPKVNEAFAYLQQFGKARLTGTGACVFLTVQPDNDVQNILEQAPCQAWLCKGLQRSPVHELLGLA